MALAAWRLSFKVRVRVPGGWAGVHHNNRVGGNRISHGMGGPTTTKAHQWPAWSVLDQEGRI